MLEPLVSVIIVNWNHRDCISDCLRAVHNQEYPYLEIFVVDNASSDGSVDWIRQNYPEVKVIAFTENRGFARAFNDAARISNGAFILSLNPDVTIEPGFIAAMTNALADEETIGIAAPKLLQALDPTLLDSTGLFIDRSRRTYDRGQGYVDSGQFDAQNDVFGACGAAAMYKRSLLNELQMDGQYYDEDFFAYYEDADLAWRAQLMGWRCVYVPAAVGLHIRGYGDTLRKRRKKNHYGPRFALRNRYLMILKNDEFTSFLSDLPFIILSEIPRIFYLAIVSPLSLFGMIDFIRVLPSAWKKRKTIQAARKMNKSEIRRWFYGVNFR
jgi:GT2 family glycosyltransferase